MVNEIFPPYEMRAKRHRGLYRFTGSLHALWKSDEPQSKALEMFSISQHESARADQFVGHTAPADCSRNQRIYKIYEVQERNETPSPAHRSTPGR